MLPVTRQFCRRPLAWLHRRRVVLMGFSSDPCQIIQQGITGKELSIFFSPERE
jgi:hypothetical protein